MIEETKKYMTALLDNRLLRQIGVPETNAGVVENREIIKSYMGWDDTKTNEDYCKLEDE